MKRHFILFTMVLIFINIGIARSQKIDLFNGKNLKGWVIENDGQFSVDKGILKVNQGAGWLRSEKMYKDFKMTMEFRFMEKGANSGIYVRIPSTEVGESNGWPASYYQVQCRDDSTIINSHLGYLFSKGVPAFDFVSSKEAIGKAYKPFGEWHTYEITCNKGTYVVRLNGEVITMAMNVKTLEGYVGIQGEFGLLEFRKIELELL